MIGFAEELIALRKAESRGNRGRAVACTEGVVIALPSECEAGKSTGSSQSVEHIASIGKKLMNIALMSYVEYYMVAR